MEVVETVFCPKEDAAKRKLLEIKLVPMSQVPYRVLKRKTGEVHHSATTEEGVNDFIRKQCLDTLKRVPVRKRYVRQH